MSTSATRVTADDFVRGQHLAAGYSPGRHAARTLALAVAIAGLGFVMAARARSAWDWVSLPAFLVASNAIEWGFHRGPMHRLLGPRVFYRNHTLIHHRAFLPDRMEVSDMRELGLVFMPWYTMLLLFVIASPIAGVAALLRGPALAGIFYVAAACYFLMYETLHALYHLPGETLRKLGLGDGRVFAALRAHHAYHHRLDRMAHVNFNVTIPLMDWVAGTKESAARPARAARARRSG